MAKIADNISLLQKNLKEAKMPSAYLFFGAEIYLAQHYLKALRKTYADGEMNHIRISAIDSFSDAVAKLRDAAAMPAMFAPAKLIELHEVDVSKLSSSDISALCDAAQSAIEYGDNVLVLYLVSHERIFGARPEENAVYRALCEKFTPVFFDLQQKQKLIPWAQRHLQNEKIAISSADADFLIDYCSRNMSYLASEIDKLCIYLRAHGKDTVRREDILTVCNPEPEFEEFAFQNSILSLSLDEALRVLDYKKGMGEEPDILMAQIMSTLGDMQKIKLCTASGLSYTEAAKKLGMNEYRAKLYAGGVRNIDTDALLNAYLEAYDCLVSLHSTAFEPYVQMRTLLCRILPSMRG